MKLILLEASTTQRTVREQKARLMLVTLTVLSTSYQNYFVRIS